METGFNTTYIQHEVWFPLWVGLKQIPPKTMTEHVSQVIKHDSISCYILVKWLICNEGYNHFSFQSIIFTVTSMTFSSYMILNISSKHCIRDNSGIIVAILSTFPSTCFHLNHHWRDEKYWQMKTSQIRNASFPSCLLHWFIHLRFEWCSFNDVILLRSLLLHFNEGNS